VRATEAAKADAVAVIGPASLLLLSTEQMQRQSSDLRLAAGVEMIAFRACVSRLGCCMVADEEGSHRNCQLAALSI